MMNGCLKAVGAGVLLAALGAVAAEDMSSETLLAAADPGKSEFYPGGRDAYYPGAAFGKDTWLVVWQAGRMQEADIVACRVAKDGKVLDAKPFTVSSAADDQERPKIAFAPSTSSGQGNGVFLAVWSDLRNGKDYDVFAARITPDGKVLDPDGILISGGPHNQVKPRLAFDGETFVVAWMDYRSDRAYQVYAARVAADGKVLDPDGIAVGKAPGFEPAVASPGGGRSLIALAVPADPQRDGFAGFFLQGGKPMPEQVAAHLPGAKPDFFPRGLNSYRSAAWGKNGYLLVCQNYIPAGRAGIQCNSDAMIIHPDGVREPFISVSGKPHRTVFPDVVWDGTSYVVSWTDPTDNQGAGDINVSRGVYSRLYASRLDETGKLLTPPGAPIAVAGTLDNPAQRPALATDGAGHTLIAYERHPDKSDVPIKIGFRILSGSQKPADAHE
jgi:hypothetical protein